MPIISLRPDVEDTIEFVDDDPSVISDSLGLGDSTDAPSLPEQAARRRKYRGLASDVRRGAA